MGFCNRTVWALFHFFPMYAIYDEEYWEQYRKVNESFSETVLEMVRPGDLVWIHDYHLMLLPRLLRTKLPDMPIGFFLHIPFPSFEIFRLLPSKWRREILEGLLGADLIGFHTHDYSQYFLRCVHRILGYEHSMGEIQAADRLVKVDTFPMGIEFKKFQESAAKTKVKVRKEELRNRFKNLKVILSIDRLDYSKGILNRLRAFELFLEKNPQRLGKVVLLLVVVPSRIGVEHYQTMKKQIDEMVGRINGRFARVVWTPIIYQYRSLSFYKVQALYGISDVILVTPLRDGMNLIAKEYVASRIDKTGVLILSEMAGAAKELGEAIIINPNTKEEIADALEEALKMPYGEQKRRNEIMQDRLRRYDVTRWATEFIESLQTFKEQQRKQEARILSPTLRHQLLEGIAQAKKKLFFFDYDGTLVPFASHPRLAVPTHDVLNVLKQFSQASNSDTILTSGRDRESLDNWFGKLKIGMIAEHGVWTKNKNEDWKTMKLLSNDWKSQLRPIFEVYADRLPASFVEEKEFSLVFHFREADRDLADLRTRELVDNLVHLTTNMGVQVLMGSKVIELRNAGVNKGTAGMHF
ncbi:MAG TPA: bifunctional alpha,alpha-trehalose-phosphate synthase (UDP-forming)/trehalose-phosphatase, partial [Acidobacteriota bacterium]